MKQTAFRNFLEDGIPVHVTIGPFLVNTSKLRQFLIDKRQDVIGRLLVMFAARMKTSMEILSSQYDEIFTKLLEKPTCIEDLVLLREWMDTIPILLHGLEEQARRYLMEYEILSEFLFALEDEDFQLKWEVVAWPNNIDVQQDETIAFLNNLEEKFHKIQGDDEVELNDRIDAFVTQAALLSRETDYAKVGLLECSTHTRSTSSTWKHEAKVWFLSHVRFFLSSLENLTPNSYKVRLLSGPL